MKKQLRITIECEAESSTKPPHEIAKHVKRHFAAELGVDEKSVAVSVEDITWDDDAPDLVWTGDNFDEIFDRYDGKRDYEVSDMGDGELYIRKDNGEHREPDARVYKVGETIPHRAPAGY